MVLLPEEVEEKGFLESRSNTFRIDLSRMDMREDRFWGPNWRQKRALDVGRRLRMFYCKVPETSEHFILNCTKYKSQREILKILSPTTANGLIPQ
ncbi:hypothetical protein TNCV_2240941 [Trichonephila clavipes]|nr:hypothetical protein TNCV_2240941 [Trichonephila clavipes]